MNQASDEDRSILRHAGLPFFFRHTPPVAVRRGAFWLGFAVVAAVTLIDVLLMPYPRGSTAASLRALFFDRPAFRDFDEGLRAIFNQYFVAALVLSGIVAPLYATYSLAMERVGGTIEFLRLSPLSTLSLVMGKMFAPAYLLHLFSGGLLAAGAVIGVVAGQAPDHVALALLSIAASAVTMHALGGLLACATLSFRGFGAVVGLGGLGFLFYSLPSGFGRVPGMGYMQYVSPFSAMDSLFWSKNAYLYWPGEVSARNEFLGYGGLVAPFVLCFHTILFVMLVWAATRWLDHPEGTALPKKAWAFLLLSVLAMALGTVPNDDGGKSLRYLGRNAPSLELEAEVGAGYFSPSIQWHYAMNTLLILGGALAGLAALDHPHRRELALEDACERLGNRAQVPASPWRRLAHAFFVSTLAAVVAGLGYGFFNQFSLVAKPYVTATLVASGTALIFVLFFMASLAFECAWVRFQSPGARVVAAGIAYSLLFASIAVPLGNAVQAGQDWKSAKEARKKAWDAETKIAELNQQIEALKGLPQDQALSQPVAAPAMPASPGSKVTFLPAGPKGRVTVLANATAVPVAVPAPAFTVGQMMAELQANLRRQRNAHSHSMSQLSTQENFALYAEDMTSQEALAELEADLSDAPLAVLWRYHRSRIFWYPLGPLAVCALILILRSWTYRSIEEEARKAMAAVVLPEARWAKGPAAVATGSNDALPTANT